MAASRPDRPDRPDWGQIIINKVLIDGDTEIHLDQLCEELSEVDIVRIARECGNKLKLISLLKFRHLTDVSLRALGDHCTELEQVLLSDNDNYTVEGVMYMIGKLRLLQLVVRNCGQAILQFENERER